MALGTGTGTFSADEHSGRILKKARRTSRKSKAKIKPKDYVRTLAELPEVNAVRMTLMSRARSAAEYRQEFEEEWRQGWYAWMQVLHADKNEDKWRSKRFMPLIFQHIEAAHPTIVSAALGGNEIWKMHGLAPDGRDSADALSELIHWQARGPSRVRKAYTGALWWSLVCGNGILDHAWQLEIEDKLVPVIVDDQDDDGIKYDEANNPIDPTDTTTKPAQVKEIHKKRVTTEDQPVVKSLNPFDVWFPAHRDDEETSPKWVFFKHPTTVGEVVEAANKDGAHLDPKAVKSWVDDMVRYSYDPQSDYDFLGGEFDMHMYDDLLSETGVGSRDETGDDDEEGVLADKRIVLLVYRSAAESFTLAPGGRIIGWSENPYSHGTTGVVVHHHHPIPGSWYARGLATVLLPQQELVNVNINRAMDVAEVGLMAPIGVDRSRISTLDDNFRWQPNSLIRTRGDPRTAVMRLDMGAPTNHALLWDDHIKKDADDTTGFSEQARGVVPQGVNTATEFSGLQANLKTRTFMHVERLKETLELSGDLLVSLNQQYMTQEQIISVIGEDGLFYRTITPEEIVGQVTVHATVTAAKMAPAMKVQQLIALTQVIVPLMEQAPQNPFVARWIRMMLVEIEVEDVDRIIPKNPGQGRSPQMENIALRKGVKIQPSMYERHDLHMESHSEEIEIVKQLIEEGRASEDEATRLMEHMEATMQMAQQAGAAMAAQQGGQGGGPGGAQGGSPERQEAQALGAVQGSQGIPGAAAPGPAAAPGRAL